MSKIWCGEKYVCIIGHSKFCLKIVVWSDLLFTEFFFHVAIFFPQDHIKFFLFTLWTSFLFTWLICMLKLMLFYILFQQTTPPPQTFASSRQLLFKKEDEMKDKNPQNTSGFSLLRAANQEFKTVTRCLVKPPDGVLYLSLWPFNCASKITGFALFKSNLMCC